FLASSAHPPDLHSFPTRRSSDLTPHLTRPAARAADRSAVAVAYRPVANLRRFGTVTSRRAAVRAAPSSGKTWCDRSPPDARPWTDRKSTRLNSSHLVISYAVFCL